MLRPVRLALVGLVAVALSAGSSLVGQTPDGAPIADQFQNLHFRSIGPASMSGRIADFAVYESNPAIFWVGTAHGGVWKTTNNGATFTPQFENEGLMSIGDVTVSQKDPDVVWVGTGEGTNRQSISWGDGLFKSTDGGKTWKNMGLRQSYHIPRIVIDPNDNNTVLVAAQGALFGPGGDRGVYKTTDGGATWKQVLKVDEDTGANDIVMSAQDPKILYASTYQRRRTQCCMNGGGPGSAIWKSTDEGDTWTKLTGGGLPSGSLGRIGIDLFHRSSNIIYAEIQAEGPVGGGRGTGGGGAGGGAGAPAGGRGAGGGGGAGFGGGGGDTGIFRSDDGGTTWKKFTSPDNRPMYFSQVRVDPNNPDRVLVASVRLYLTIDGGKTFMPIDPAVHDDKHAIWWDPNNSDHILIGTDGGAYQTYDMGKTWVWFPNLPVGLFYHVGFDYEYPYNVCGGMQDNYDWCGPSAVRTRNGISNDRWQSVQGGDGFVAIIDARDHNIVYSETQDGNTMRHNKLTGESKSIRPTPENVTNAQPGTPACDTPMPGAGGRGGGSGPCANYRFNWDTPMVFSPTDPGVLYIAGNHVFRSTDRGDSWDAVSPDLTTNANRNDVVTMGVKGSDIRISKDDGISAWPTVVSFAESPKQAGLYYAGTDDGVVSVSKDAGKNWDKTLADRMPGFVKGGWVSKVLPSRYDAGTVYVASDAHRLNDYETHIWVSHDFGATFQSMNGNLKGEAIKTLTEDQRNADVIYAGAETGIFVSLDRGKSWQRLKANFPDVRVDEMTLHPRDNAMLIATHGRAIWILDHLSPIQEYAAAQAAPSGAKLFSIDPALEWKSFDDKNDEFWGHQFFVGENPPYDAVIQYYLKSAAKDAALKITDAAGKDVREIKLAGDDLQPGIQTACWDMRVEPLPAPAGGAAGFGRGGGGGAGRGGGRGGPAWGEPQPEPGYSSANVCGGAEATRGGGGRGGGGATQGPMVVPGTYTVALVVDGKTIESKPLKVVADPALQLTDAQRKRYFDMLMDLHELQRRGTQVTEALNPFDAQMTEAAAKLKDAKNVPEAVKTQFDTLSKDYADTKDKFGVGEAPGGGRGGRGGGGFGGPPANPKDLVAKAGRVKGEIMAFSEMPSDTLVKQYTDVKSALPKAIADANAMLIRALTVSQALKKYDITLTVPAPIK